MLGQTSQQSLSAAAPPASSGCAESPSLQRHWCRALLLERKVTSSWALMSYMEQTAAKMTITVILD